jgi:hypothetical protein
MAVTLPAGLPRVVPPSGAVISGVEVPGGVRVSCPSVFGFYLIPSADGRKPECPFRLVFRRDFCAPARVSSRSVASAGIQSIRELVGCVLERAAQLPGRKVSDKVFRSLVMALITSRSLAYCELYLAFAYLFRRFDVREDPSK